jgi:hypothetical protein
LLSEVVAAFRKEKLVIWILLIAAFFGLPSQSLASQVKRDVALHLLSSARPDVRWDPKSGLIADFDCDGSPDAAFLGRTEGNVFVGLVRAASAQPEILEFGVGGAAQSALCDGPGKLALESLDYDPAEEVSRIDGFVRSRRCKGLVLSGGECDPIHLFWNHKTNRLEWWRL